MKKPAAAHFDRLETRPPRQREAALLAALPKQIAHAKRRAPGFARIFAKIKPEKITSRAALAALPGKSINFGVAGVDEECTILPSFTLAMNSLAPGDAQRAHRHNAIAVMLIVQGAGCYSMIDGRRIDWEQDAVVITPPGAAHSHHNAGDDRALFLIVQDGGLHYHCRTMEFSFT